MYRCRIGCTFESDDPWKFLNHLIHCTIVASWIGGWAQRMARRPDWRERVGLVPRG